MNKQVYTSPTQVDKNSDVCSQWSPNAKGAVQDGLGTELEKDTRTVGTSFQETKGRIGTAGAYVKNLEPRLSEIQKNETWILQRKHPNQKPEPLEPFTAQSETEPSRT